MELLTATSLLAAARARPATGVALATAAVILDTASAGPEGAELLASIGDAGAAVTDGDVIAPLARAVQRCSDKLRVLQA